MKTVYIKWCRTHKPDDDKPFIKSVKTTPDLNYQIHNLHMDNKNLIAKNSIFYDNRYETCLSQFECRKESGKLYFMIHHESPDGSRHSSIHPVGGESGSGNYRDQLNIYCYETKNDLFKKVNSMRKSEYTTCCDICESPGCLRISSIHPKGDESEHDYQGANKKCWDKMIRSLKKYGQLTLDGDCTIIIWFEKTIRD